MQIHSAGLFARKSVPPDVLQAVADRFAKANIRFFDDLRSMESPPAELDWVIALGGDGTVLRALRLWPGVPLLAVNFGHVGFLSQCDSDELLMALDRLLEGRFEIEERLALEVAMRDRQWRCINELVIRGGTRMIEVDVSIDHRLVQSPRGDGVIVGTPTGATAYLLSAGGPLVTPKVDCILVQPLNEHSLSSRTVIVPGDAEIELRVWRDHHQMGRDELGASVDGQPRVWLHSGETLQLCRSKTPVRLITLDGDSFFRNLRKRLRW